MHDWFTLGMGTCGTLSLDFPVLAEEEIVCRTRSQKKLQVPRPMHSSRALHSGRSAPLSGSPGKGSPTQSGQVKDRIHVGQHVSYPAPQ